MGRHEAKHVKRSERPISDEVFLGRRGTHLLLSLLVIVLSVVAVLYAALGLTQYSHYTQLARAKALEHAKVCASLVDGADLSGGEDGAGRINARLAPLFELSSCTAGDSVSWGVYTASGTRFEMLAGDCTVTPSQQHILTARSEGSCVDRDDPVCCAVAIITHQGKIAGFVQVAVDYSAYVQALLDNYLILAAALVLGVAVFILVFLLLGCIRRLRERDFEKLDAREGFRSVISGYSLRAMLVSAAIILLCAVGIVIMNAQLAPICSAEHDELLLQNSALRSAAITLEYGADTDAARQSALLEGFDCHGTRYSFTLSDAADGAQDGVPVYSGGQISAVLTAQTKGHSRLSFSLPLIAVLTLILSAFGGTIYLIAVSRHDRRIEGERALTVRVTGIGGGANG